MHWTTYAATKNIRSLPRPDAQTIPIFAVTADAFSDDMHACLQAGMNGYVAKPIQIEKILELLYQILQ